MCVVGVAFHENDGNDESDKDNSDSYNQEWPRQTKPKKGQFMNFSQGHSGTKVRYVNRACFPKEKQARFTKMGEIHELFVLALFFGLVCRGDS